MDLTWHGLIHCARCNALHSQTSCPVCEHRLDLEPHRIVIDDVELVVPQAMQGAIPWSIYILLEQIKIEAVRPIVDLPGRPAKLSQRFTVVLLFWTLFEILIDAFYRAAFADLPGTLGDELLERFSGIGGRLDRLYRRTWSTTFWDDLTAEGFGQEAMHLRKVQKIRNAFMHGDPEAIDEELVEQALAHLEAVQLAWIVLFNKRCTGRQNRIPIWSRREPRLASNLL